MQVSKKQVSQMLEKQVSQMWYQLVADIKTPEDAAKILKAMLTDTEVMVIIKRLAVAYWLTKKRSYENIKENLKVSSATIASVQQDIKKDGWKLAMQKVLAEEWATKWEAKIKGLWPKGDK